MRIAIAAHSARRVGGVEQYLATVVPALMRAGHDVACWFETDGTRSAADPRSRGCRAESWRASRRSRRAALAALRAWRPDVVFTHGIADVGAGARAARRGAVRALRPLLLRHVHQRHQDGAGAGHALLHAHVRPLVPAAVLPAPLRRLEPDDDGAALRACSGRASRCSTPTRAIVVASRHMAEEYARHGPVEGAASSASRSKSPQPVPGRAPARSERRLLYLGRLEASKGADVALESAARAAARWWRPVHLQMSGAGTLHETLAGARRRADAGAAAAARDVHRLARRAPSCRGARPERPAARAEPLARAVRHGRRRSRAARRAVGGLWRRRHSRVADRWRHRPAGAGRPAQRRRASPTRSSASPARSSRRSRRMRERGRRASRRGSAWRRTWRRSSRCSLMPRPSPLAAPVAEAEGVARMNMRVLFAIHGPADEAHGGVSIRAPARRGAAAGTAIMPICWRPAICAAVGRPGSIRCSWRRRSPPAAVALRRGGVP